MNVKLNLGTLITIVTLSIGIGSSWYSLTDDLEVQVKIIKKKNKTWRIGK